MVPLRRQPGDLQGINKTWTKVYILVQLRRQRRTADEELSIIRGWPQKGELKVIMKVALGSSLACVRVSRGRSPNPHKHRGGRERSETLQEEEAIIDSQLAELNETPEIKEQTAQVLREAYLKKYGSEPGRCALPVHPGSECFVQGMTKYPVYSISI